jgi:hypothetical protein
MKNWTLSLIAAILFILLIELVSFIILKKRKEDCHAGKNLYAVAMDDYMGYVLKKNSRHRAVKTFSDNSIIYDVVYATDRYRRRDVGQKYMQENPHLILFGCSLIYGEGLNDNETLQHMLAEGFPGYNIYNYAVHGYGPQHMLALLEKGDLPSEVKSDKGLAIYVFDVAHVYRAISSTRIPGLFSSPYYYLDRHDMLHKSESFAGGRPVLSAIYRIFIKLRSVSNFLKVIRLDLPFRMSKKDIYLASRIIREAKKLYEEQFDGKFYVLIHPFCLWQKKRVRQMTEFLKEGGINILYYDIPGNLEQFRIKGDGHPNSKLNKFLSGRLRNDLEGSHYFF